MLWSAEVHKLLRVRRGALLLVVCLLAKILLLCVYPEMKDPRIGLSQNQYNRYLGALYGESSPGKNAWAQQEYAWCLDTIARRESVEQQYAQHALSEEAYRAYTEELDRAYLHRNSAQIFAEKAEQFAAQGITQAPGWYIYEYGWQTVFFLGQFPDIFLLFGLLILAAQSFPAESAAGMLPVLLAAKNGKSRLFWAKLLALLSVGAVAALVFGGAEALVFYLRGCWDDPQAPIYSVSIMTGCKLPVSLCAGYAAAMLIRAYAALLFSAVVFGLSVWIKNPIQTVFAGMCLLILPMFLGGSIGLLTHSGLLRGTLTLNTLEPTAASWLIPLSIVTGYSGAIVCLSLIRHRRGM